LSNGKKNYCHPCENECYPQPDFAADCHFPFGSQVIPESNADKYGGNGNENDSY
jgi:hypothetical protein